jgi:KaiC/GvpD/RAD55 family RecA-like ATPase
MVDAQNHIQDVPVTVRSKRRSTGIIGLNLLLDGGFPEGTIIMVYGTPVAGVDLAAHQFWKGDRSEDGTYLMNDGDVDADMIDATEMHPDLYLTQMAGKRIVIDSLSMPIVKYGIDVVLKFLANARDEMRRRSANMVFVVYTNIHTPIEMTRIMRAADIVIEFKTMVHQGEVERIIEVQKIKDSAVPQRLLPFNITDNGIEASTTSRVV